MHKLLSEREIEEIYGIKCRSLQKMRYTGDGPIYVNIGRSVRYRVSDIEEFIEARLTKSTSDNKKRKEEGNQDDN